MTGGYKIIDLKGKDHTVGVGMVHDGIYDAIEGTKKPIMLSNIVIAGTEYKDIFVTVNLLESAFIIDVYGYTFTVQSTDVVTVTANT